jgi:hypothetical protein
VSDLKPGEYVGKDGIRCQWEPCGPENDRWIQPLRCNLVKGVRTEDARAAGEALIAWADAQVEVLWELNSKRLVLKDTGPFMQWQDHRDGKWYDDLCQATEWVGLAYQAGLERGGRR